MPRTQSSYTRVKNKSSKIQRSPVETLASWDDAINKAKHKIERLRQAIRTFEESKKSGEPWPGDEDNAKARP